MSYNISNSPPSLVALVVYVHASRYRFGGRGDKMYQEILKQTGLSENESIIYELLLDLGVAKAGEVAKKSPLKRSLVYKILEDLTKKGLVSQITKENKKHFQVEPPD